MVSEYQSHLVDCWAGTRFLCVCTTELMGGRRFYSWGAVASKLKHLVSWPHMMSMLWYDVVLFDRNVDHFCLQCRTSDLRCRTLPLWHQLIDVDRSTSYVMLYDIIGWCALYCIRSSNLRFVSDIAYDVVYHIFDVVWPLYTSYDHYTYNIRCRMTVRPTICNVVSFS